ncbi:MAG: hypothetical protein HZB15_01620 [Actinobacteria bacterium]|nr:hypothetical protein [Actinomycetota bacterium]
MKIKSKSGAVIGALIAAGLVSASAASLGGLTSETLGAESDVVAGCDPDGIDIAYVTDYNETTQDYEVIGVRLLGVADTCIGQLASVALDDASGDGAPVLTEESEKLIALSDIDGVDQGTDTDVTDDFLITITSPVNADAVENIALVIA